MRDGNRVSARQTKMPLKTNGTAAPLKVQMMDPQSVSELGTKRKAWAKIAAAMESAKSNAHRPIRTGNLASGQACGRRNTASAPTVMPNMAIEIAMKAKWYHMVSENTRVSSTSNIRVANVTRNSAPERRSGSSLLLAQFADRGDLRGEVAYLGLRCRHANGVLCSGAGDFGLLQRLHRFGLVEVRAADRGVGKDGDDLRLHFQDATGDEDELLLAAARRGDAHRAGLDARDERRVARVDAELARLARQHHELRLAREDALLGADYVDVQRGGGHQSFFAFSNASSIGPTM